MIDIDTYNNLPLVSDADALFNKQLASAGITRNQLFSKLAPLFVEDANAGRYAACLIHHHYDLKPGERMVTNNLSTKPLEIGSDSFSANIIAQIWLRTGEAIEYRVVTDSSTANLPPPPPAEFFEKFRSLLDPIGIDILGVCLADAELEDGFIWQESDGPGDRERIFTIIPRTAKPAPGYYEVTWIPKLDKDGQSTMGCGTNCGTCERKRSYVLSKVDDGDNNELN